MSGTRPFTQIWKHHDGTEFVATPEDLKATMEDPNNEVYRDAYDMPCGIHVMANARERTGYAGFTYMVTFVRLEKGEFDELPD